MAINLKRKERDQLELNAVRKCSIECYFFKNGGDGCPYYQKKQVKHGETCLYDIVHLKQYADAFSSGNLDFIKQDASGVTAMVMLQVRRMLEQVNMEGVTVEEPILDGKGNPIWIPDPMWRAEHGGQRPMVVAMRKKDHPLIQRCVQLARSMGLNLDSFKLTPKSADEKRQVSGRILIENQQQLKDIMKDREATEARFTEAIKQGNKMTSEDPVFRKLMDEGDIVG